MSVALTAEERMAFELAWAHEHDGDPATWHDTCRAVHPLFGAMCDLHLGQRRTGLRLNA